MTLANLKDRTAMNFVWSERGVNLEASVFATIVIKYFKQCKAENPSITKFIIWADNYIYQNKNKDLANALLQFSHQHGVEVYQKYLEREHTLLEADTVHSKIENAKKRLGNPPTLWIHRYNWKREWKS